MKLFLTHNPYTIDTEFFVDNNKCNDFWFETLITCDGRPLRLQMWIALFFDRLHQVFADVNDFNLTFKGTKADCDDIKIEAEAAQGRLGISIAIATISCGNPENKLIQLKKLYQEAENGPYEGFRTIEQRTHGFTRISENIFSVSIMAPMKNGKSTLLNAILGQDILPSKTQRCTAKISYIENSNKCKVYEGKKIYNDSSTSEYVPCTKEILGEWNNDNSVRNVKIRGGLPGFGEANYRLQFVDTPGPDSAVHPEDGATIDGYLNDHSLPMVCFIINIINEAEARYLERIKNQMSKYGKQSEERFLFIVSRMDQVEGSRDDTHEHNEVKSKIESIRDDLQKLGINNPRIFPVTAKIALDVRQYHLLSDEDEREKLDKDDIFEECQRFGRRMDRISLSLMDYMSISPSIKNTLNKEFFELREKIKTEKILTQEFLRYFELLSGIPALEKSIEEYIVKYSVPAKIYEIASLFMNEIKQVNAEKELIEKIESHKLSLEKINDMIKALSEHLVKGKEAQKLRSDMFKEKWTESSALKKELSGYERDYNARIKSRISDWSDNVETLESDGTIAPEEAQKLVEDFYKFMKGISCEMLGVFSTAVKDDADEEFKKVKRQYDDKIKDILGEMPEELQQFVKHFDFVLHSDTQINIEINKKIVENTETYIETVCREITFEKDGFWKGLWSCMPFTDNTLTEQVERSRTTRRMRVVFNDLKKNTKEAGSIVVASSIRAANSLSEKQYNDLRKAMLDKFDQVDTKLSDFNKELENKKCAMDKEKTRKEEYEKIYNWVGGFQTRLGQVLKLED